MDVRRELADIRDKAVELRNDASFDLYNKYIYRLVRKHEPEIFVESGVAGGATTYCILKAMQKNEKGHLYSFDPGHEHVGDESDIGLDDAEYKKHPPGELVPDSLKDRWTFTRAKFMEAAPMKLRDVRGDVDMFFHDSDHSDENINSEFAYMEQMVRDDGYLLIHDPPTDFVDRRYELVEGPMEGRKWALRVYKPP